MSYLQYATAIMLTFTSLVLIASVWMQRRLFRQLDRDRQEWIERQHSFLSEAIKASEMRADVENLKLAVKRLTAAPHN